MTQEQFKAALLTLPPIMLRQAMEDLIAFRRCGLTQKADGTFEYVPFLKLPKES